MIVKFDKPTKAIDGAMNNTGSCRDFVNYMRKEEQASKKQGRELQTWFDYFRDNITHAEVVAKIDKDHQGLSKKEGKFATGSINITEKEWKAMGKTDRERIGNG